MSKQTKINQHHWCVLSLPVEPSLTQLLTSVLTSPACRVIAKPRCYSKGHLVLCQKHGNFYNPYFACVRCKGEVRRGDAESDEATQGKTN
jgi:hypothetical protein